MAGQAKMKLLGIDVGGTKSAVLVGTRSGEVLDRCEWPSKAARGPEPMLREICQHARRLLATHKGQISSAGVSIGGPIDCRNGVIHSPPNLPGWDALPLKQLLHDSLQLPVQVMHDAAACAMAEYRWGAGKGCQRLAYLTCGTGLGVGLVFDGKPYMGAGGRSPELGHVRLAPKGPTAYGKAGSVEAFCSGTGLGLTAAWLYPARWGANPPSGAALAKLAGQGDADAAAVLKHSAVSLGNVCAMIGDILALDRIVLGSLGRYLGAAWIEQVREVFAAEVLASVKASCRIEPAGLGQRLQDCSALAAAMTD